MTQSEAERANLQAAMDGLRENANNRTEALVETIRNLFGKIQGNLAKVAAPAE